MPDCLNLMNSRSAPPNPALFPPIERSAPGRRLPDPRAACARNQRIADGPVMPSLRSRCFSRRTRSVRLSQRRARSMRSCRGPSTAMEHGLVHVTHPRYFGLFNPAPAFPAQCADRVAGAFNPQLATATTSPAAVEIEAHVIRAVAQRAGFALRCRGAFHQWRLRSQLHRADLRADPRARALRQRRRARL